jgi:hypothetical protein
LRMSFSDESGIIVAFRGLVAGSVSRQDSFEKACKKGFPADECRGNPFHTRPDSCHYSYRRFRIAGLA